MKDGNNGGYANNWLLADIKTNEIASLELGLKNVTLEKKTDGYFVGSNFPVNENLIREETDFDPKDMSVSANARHVRWEQLMAENKGKIDVSAAERFMADHYDTYTKKEDADERTLDGHIDLSPRGSPPWQPPHGNAGAVQNKVADATMIAAHVIHRPRRPRLRHGLQSRRPAPRAPRIRLGARRTTRHGRLSLDQVLHRKVGVVLVRTSTTEARRHRGH